MATNGLLQQHRLSATNTASASGGLFRVGMIAHLCAHELQQQLGVHRNLVRIAPHADVELSRGPRLPQREHAKILIATPAQYRAGNDPDADSGLDENPNPWL